MAPHAPVSPCRRFPFRRKGISIGQTGRRPMAYKLNVNGKVLSADVAADTPLLWTLRASLGIVGPKFGCGLGACGACTVNIDGHPMCSCQIPAWAGGR